MWHKGVQRYHVESDILKEGTGTKYPGRWEVAKLKIPSVKMLFKTNTNCHKHRNISLIIIEQDTTGETKENEQVAFSTGTAHSLKPVLYAVMGCS